MTEHRVSMLGNSLRRYEDPTQSSDPQIVALLAALHDVDIAPPLRDEFRAELRTQLVAIAPRIVADGLTEDAGMIDIVPRPTPAQLRTAAAQRLKSSRDLPSPTPRTLRTRLRLGSILRPLGVATAVFTVFAMLLGGAVWMSQDAVPGDSLYGLKRASERFQIYTDSTDSEKALDYLEFAGRRIAEARTLVSRVSTSASGGGILASGGLSDETKDHVVTVLHSADADTRSAVRLLGDEALSSASGAPLARIATWAPVQLSRLQRLRDALPAGDSDLSDQTKTSSSVVRQAATRAAALEKNVDCVCLDKARKDNLGPLPCAKCARGTQVRPPAASRTRAATSVPSRPVATPARSSGTPRTSAVAPPPQQRPRPSSINPRVTSKPAGPVRPTLPRLRLPTITPKPPITITPSCISVLDLLAIGCKSP